MVSDTALSRKGWHGQVGLLSAATISVGLANYLMAIALVHLLPANQYAHFAAGQGLLLVLGTGSMAALPWAVARYIASSSDSDTLAKAMRFGLVGSAFQALILAPIAFVVCYALDGLTFGTCACIATILISLLAGPTGFLQGTEQLASIAVMRVIETTMRIVVSLGLVWLLSRNDSVALIGFPIGSAVALVFALRRGRAAFPLRRMAAFDARALLRRAALLGAIQVLLAAIGALDSVYADGAALGAGAIASYQAAALLGRVPLFLSSAISTAGYTSLVTARGDRECGTLLRQGLRTYTWLAVPFVVGCLTVPPRLVHIAVPAAYTQVPHLLKITCLTGVIVGAINIVTTGHQARLRFRSCIGLLVSAAVVQAVALLTVGQVAGIFALAWTAFAVAGVTLLVLLVDGRRWLRPDRLAIDVNVLPIYALALIAGIGTSQALWALSLAALALLSIRRALSERGVPDPPVRTSV